MHIPDGFLDARTAVTSGVLAAGGIGLALADLRRSLPPRRVPLLGLGAAFVFAAQMLNFPIAGGTSGHLIGAALVVAMLGPSAAVVVMCAVVILQALMFADGGITALGANLLNLAVVAPGVAALAYAAAGALGVRGLRGRLFGAAVAAWCSTLAAAIACAGELAASGTARWTIAFPAMTWIHMLIGVGEALITVLVTAAVARTRPELLDPAANTRWRPLALQGLAAALGLIVFIAPFASTAPDGLQTVAARLGFASRATTTLTPLAEDALPGLGSPVAATVLAGAIGTLLAFVLAYFLALGLTPRSRALPADTGSSGLGSPPR